MKIENNKFVELTEAELFSLYLERGMDDAMDFHEYRHCKNEMEAKEEWKLKMEKLLKSKQNKENTYLRAELKNKEKELRYYYGFEEACKLIFGRRYQHECYGKTD